MARSFKEFLKIIKKKEVQEDREVERTKMSYVIFFSFFLLVYRALKRSIQSKCIIEFRSTIYLGDGGNDSVK